MRRTKRESVNGECKDTGKPFLRPKSWRLKISEARKRYYEEHPNKKPSGKKNPMYGISRFGKKNPNFSNNWSDEQKEKLSKKVSGKNSSWYGKKHTIVTRKKMVESGKRVKKTEEWKRKMRESALKRAKRQGHISYNPHACKYFDDLNKKRRWNLQHALNGGEIECVGYSLDAYDKKKNIVVEYDEPHHYTIYGNLKRKDKQRQKRIINELNCKFYRFNQKENKLIKI